MSKKLEIPTDEEVKEHIAPAYDKLFDVLETKETDEGVALFSRDQKAKGLKSVLLDVFLRHQTFALGRRVSLWSYQESPVHRPKLEPQIPPPLHSRRPRCGCRGTNYVLQHLLRDSSRVYGCVHLH